MSYQSMPSRHAYHARTGTSAEGNVEREQLVLRRQCLALPGGFFFFFLPCVKCAALRVYTLNSVPVVTEVHICACEHASPDMYIYAHRYTHAHFTPGHIKIHFVDTHGNTRTYLHPSTSTLIHIYTHPHPHRYISTYIHIYTYPHTYTSTHVHTCPHM